MSQVKVADLEALPERQPYAVTVAGRDLIVIRHGASVSILHGRCPHRGARLSEARVEGDLIVCGSHGWSFSCRDGQSPGSPEDSLQRFQATIDPETKAVLVDEDEVARWSSSYTEPFDPDELML